MAAGVVLTGPLWTALSCAARFRDANLLAYLCLPGGLALTCTVLHLPVFDMFFLEEILNVLLLCFTLSPFHFFYTKFCLKSLEGVSLLPRPLLEQQVRQNDQFRP